MAWRCSISIKAPCRNQITVWYTVRQTDFEQKAGTCFLNSSNVLQSGIISNCAPCGEHWFLLTAHLVAIISGDTVTLPVSLHHAEQLGCDHYVSTPIHWRLSCGIAFCVFVKNCKSWKWQISTWKLARNVLLSSCCCKSHFGVWAYLLFDFHTKD